MKIEEGKCYHEAKQANEEGVNKGSRVGALMKRQERGKGAENVQTRPQTDAQTHAHILHI